jgi:plasmid stability protein
MHYASIMPSLTIRDVPDETHAELAARAALAGQSLQAYLRSQLIELAKRPDARALMARVHARKQRTGTRLSAEQILAYRDADRR